MSVTRRAFLHTAGAVASVAILQPTRELFAATEPGRSIVVVQLAGGNDALNTVIPYTDPRYRSLRPSLAIPDAEIIQLDGALGLHPSLSSFADLYRRGFAAFVTGVGFPSLDRSHFHCQDVWQTAMEGDAHDIHSAGGWLGRLADHYFAPAASPLVSLAVGSRIPLGMMGERVMAGAIADAATFDVATDIRYAADHDPFLDTLRELYDERHTATSPQETIRAFGRDMFASIELVDALPPANPAIAYPSTNLGRALGFAGRALAGSAATRFVWVTLGGFDTHNSQAVTHANLLRDLSDSLAAFWRDAESARFADRTVVMAWSEFGRRAQENASNGTDHGKAGTIMLLGNAINGATMYGDAPDLGRLEDGDLRTEIDFRSVYSTLIHDWMRLDPHPVLHGHYDSLGFIRASAGPRRRAVAR